MKSLKKNRTLDQETMLNQIEQVLSGGAKGDPPAYTLILGAGASAGIVPTAGEMLGIPSATGSVHPYSIPVWLERRLQGRKARGVMPEPAKWPNLVREFWRILLRDNPRLAANPNSNADEVIALEDGVPDQKSVATAYKAIFSQQCSRGLNTPSQAREFLRDICFPRGQAVKLNATYFYLASLLSLQRQTDETGVGGKPLYVGGRPFAQTVLTTNFDPFLQTALQLFQMLYYMTDQPELLVADPLRTDESSAVHLFYAHGSVNREFLANTDREIALLQKNAHDLAGYLGDHGVIILGYSGWDDCLLQALNQTKRFANNLYWLVRRGTEPSDSVRAFLEDPNHSNVFGVEIEDGGKLLAELHARLCPGAPNTQLLHTPYRLIYDQLAGIDLQGIPSGAEYSTATMGAEAAGGLANDGRSPGAMGPSSEPTARLPPEDVNGIRIRVMEMLVEDERRLSAPDSTAGFEKRADLAYANRNWEAALGAYDQLLTRKDLSAEQAAKARFRRGVCYDENGQPERALDDYAAVIDMPGASVEVRANALGSRATRRRLDGGLSEAIADLSTVVGLAGPSLETRVRALFDRASCFEQWNQDDQDQKALGDYTAIVNLEGISAEAKAWALFYRGNLRTRMNQVALAIADFTTVIETPNVPTQPKASSLGRRGLLYRAKRDTANLAIADFTAIVNEPGVPVDWKAQALFDRALCRTEPGALEQVIADYTAVSDLVGVPPVNKAWALLRRGQAFQHSKNLPAAISDFTAVIEMRNAGRDPTIRALEARASAYRLNKDIALALADYAAIVDATDVTVDMKFKVLFERSTCRLEAGQGDQRVADYTAMLDLPGVSDEGKARALLLRATALAERAEGAPQAEADLESIRALANAPHDLRDSAEQGLRELRAASTKVAAAPVAAT